MPRIHLIIGPVGAGKSTFARTLAAEERAVRLGLDDWMAKLYGADERPADRLAWYRERTERCLEVIWSITEQLIAAGTNVVLEIGLIRRAEREAFYARVDRAAFDLTVHVLDAPRDVRRERVQKRNAQRGETFSMVVPDAIFELASDMWEPPDELERDERNVRVHAPA